MPRIAVINEERCNPQGCGNYLCIRVCPVNKEGQECIFPNPTTKKAAIAENLCTGCGICPNRCPFDAISIINLPEALDKPIHRYGRNGFHLYKMPIPFFGKVVGVLGRNGVGKSTAIKIIAGMLKPNLGKDESVPLGELIKYFRGTEAQHFFEKQKQKKIVVSYKPQHVDMLPTIIKDKVGIVLKKVDEKNAFDKIVNILDLKELLDRNMNQLSGGELQRVAIAAASLKKANIYIFDEPTSYLDIKQRIKVAQFLRSLSQEDNNAVLVVEHDLVILDYMTDLLQVMYGKPAAYGVVSLPRTSKTGMNTFLEGYIKDENMRFRDQSIKFLARPPEKKSMKIELTSWTEINKNLDEFNLKIKEGSIHQNEVVGVLGENGIGKTTFVKLLAGIINADSGKINKFVKVSYKPQYLLAETDESVANVLHEAIQKYDLQLIQPLELKHLLQKNLNQLSGGELQRVAIAHCLSQEADLYLLDEPSAYLDIEQRLMLSKIMKNFTELKKSSILIVDHDLVFLDYVSDRLIVFDGIPAKKGIGEGPFTLRNGMNIFLKRLKITLRRDQESNRPRINKPESVLDREQKEKGEYYYG
ncbi:ribosome biogenesis/translation initiation ATPase RLI [Candidatus Woesearchaeota archaeon]|nr:ribosome biogenesis/translation initiation ATPase RLI [Candidatus Woesearchaeota archaeon]